MCFVTVLTFLYSSQQNSQCVIIMLFALLRVGLDGYWFSAGYQIRISDV